MIVIGSSSSKKTRRPEPGQVMWEWRKESARALKEAGATAWEMERSQEGKECVSLLSFLLRQMMVSRVFHQEKKFRRTDFREETAVCLFPKWFSFTQGEGDALPGIMNVFGLFPNSDKKKPRGRIQLLKSFANSSPMLAESSVDGGKLSIFQIQTREGLLT